MDQAIIRIRDGGAAQSGAWLSSLGVSSTAMQIGGLPCAGSKGKELARYYGQ
jgi:hypothetical protein